MREKKKLQFIRDGNGSWIEGKNQGMQVVCDPSSELRGYNFTCYNFFTSLNLEQFLRKGNIMMLGSKLSQQTINKYVYIFSFHVPKHTTFINSVFLG